MAPGLTVLLADDDKVQTLMLSSVLRARGYRVDSAFDATQTFTTAIRTKPDVIVLDIQMPGGTGMLVLERLKASTKTSQIPVIVLSGSTDPEAEPSVRKLGADVFLSKPVDVDELLGALSRVLGQSPSPTP
ncbi:MAG: response regulator [Gemmatimonadota bacterium]